MKAPSGESKLKVLKAIAQEYNIEWDSSNTEAEFNKKYEDLLVAFANHITYSLIIRHECIWKAFNVMSSNQVFALLVSVVNKTIILEELHVWCFCGWV